MPFTFKNAFCALCHGVEKENLVAWESSLSCGSDIKSAQNSINLYNLDLMSRLVSNGSCQLQFSRPSSARNARTCQTGHDLNARVRNELEDARAYNICTSAQAQLCMSYIIPYEGFRNPHCELCFNRSGSPPEDEGRLRMRRDAPLLCKDDPSSLRPTDNGDAKKQGGVLLLLDITGRYSQEQGSSFSPDRVEYICKDDQVYDPLLQSCHELSCPYGFEPYRGQCIEIQSDIIYVPVTSQLHPATWDTITSSMAFPLSPGGYNVGCSDLLKAVKARAYIDNFSMAFENITIYTFIDEIPMGGEHAVDRKDEEQMPCTNRRLLFTQSAPFQTVEISIRVGFGSFKTNLEEVGRTIFPIIKRLGISNFNVSMTNTNDHFRGDPTCPENGVLASIENVTYQEHKDREYVVMNSTSVQFYYPVRSIGFEQQFIVSNGYINSDSFSMTFLVCERSSFFSYENCSVVSYRRNETKEILNGTQLQLVDSGKVFEESHFYIVGDRVLVCSNLGFENRTGSGRCDDDIVYKTLSWVCSSISIFFLAVMLIIYWEFPELLTLPGRLIACLAATMMLTFALNLLTLVDIHHSVLCPIVGVMAHFVTLAHYGWMSAIAVNMALTFGSSSVRSLSLRDESAVFLRYNMAVWGVCALIVSVSLTLDLTHGDESSVRNSSGNLTSWASSSLSTFELTPLPSSTTEDYTSQSDLPSVAQHSSEPLGNKINDTLSSTRASLDISEDSYINTTSISSDSSWQFPRYGYPYCSWFSGPLWTRLAFILIPYAVTLVIDVIGFSLTMRGILASAKASAETLHKGYHYRTQCIIFLKLSTAMGFSWVLSVFFIVSESRVLVYVYVTLVLMQGLLLFLAFMVNKRVISLFKRKLSKPGSKLYGHTPSSATRSSNLVSSSETIIAKS